MPARTVELGCGEGVALKLAVVVHRARCDLEEQLADGRRGGGRRPAHEVVVDAPDARVVRLRHGAQPVPVVRPPRPEGEPDGRDVVAAEFRCGNDLGEEAHGEVAAPLRQGGHAAQCRQGGLQALRIKEVLRLPIGKGDALRHQIGDELLERGVSGRDDRDRLVGIVARRTVARVDPCADACGERCILLGLTREHRLGKRRLVAFGARGHQAPVSARPQAAPDLPRHLLPQVDDGRRGAVVDPEHDAAGAVALPRIGRCTRRTPPGSA